MSWKDVLKKDSIMKYLRLSQNPENIKLIGVDNAGCAVVKKVILPYKNIDISYINEELFIQKKFNDIDKVTVGKDVIILVCYLGEIFGANTLLSFVKKLIDKNIVPIVIVTTPFNFEGRKREECANNTIEEISRYDKNILMRIINMDKIKITFPEGTTVPEAYTEVDRQVIEEIINLCNLLMYK